MISQNGGGSKRAAYVSVVTWVTPSPRLHDLTTNLTCLSANCSHLLYIHESHIYYSQPTEIIQQSGVNLFFSRYDTLFTFDILAFSLCSAYQSISRCHAEEKCENDTKKTKNCQAIIDWGDHMGYSHIAF